MEALEREEGGSLQMHWTGTVMTENNLLTWYMN